jgi:hypothetical protein
MSRFDLDKVPPMSDAFPKCKAAGLEVYATHAREATPWVRASDVEALLEKATVIELIEACQLNGKPHWRTPNLNDAEGGTHLATVINVRPIEKPDTAEGLLKELIGNISARDKLGYIDVDRFPHMRDLIERAKRLLK